MFRANLHEPGTLRTIGNAIVPSANMAGPVEHFFIALYNSSYIVSRTLRVFNSSYSCCQPQKLPSALYEQGCNSEITTNGYSRSSTANPFACIAVNYNSHCQANSNRISHKSQRSDGEVGSETRGQIHHFVVHLAQDLTLESGF
jgi:hypothetical protein